MTNYGYDYYEQEGLLNVERYFKTFYLGLLIENLILHFSPNIPIVEFKYKK